MFPLFLTISYDKQINVAVDTKRFLQNDNCESGFVRNILIFTHTCSEEHGLTSYQEILFISDAIIKKYSWIQNASSQNNIPANE